MGPLVVEGVMALVQNPPHRHVPDSKVTARVPGARTRFLLEECEDLSSELQRHRWIASVLSMIWHSELAEVSEVLQTPKDQVARGNSSAWIPFHPHAPRLLAFFATLRIQHHHIQEFHRGENFVCSHFGNNDIANEAKRGGAWVIIK